MDALPAPFLNEPTAELDVRRIWATIARSAWLILGCVLLALAAGVVAVRRLEPVYQASASVRLDAKGGASQQAALLGLSSDNTTLIATALEVLLSRSLAMDVADSLGLRLQLDEPRRTPRSAVIAWAQVDSTAPLRGYRFSAAGTGQVRVREEGSSRDVGTFPLAGVIALPGVRLRLADGALAQGDVLAHVVTLESAGGFVRGHTSASQPNTNANVLAVTFEWNDPVTVRDAANALAALFVRHRLENEKAAARTQVELMRRQLDTLNAQQRAAENAVTAFLTANKIISVDNEANQRASEIARLTELRIQYATDRASILGSLDMILQTSDSTDRRQAVERLIATPAFLRAQGTASPATQFVERLRRQEDALAQARQRYLPTDPDVKAIEREIEITKRDIAATTRIYAEGLAQQVRAIDQRIALLQSAIQQIPAQQVEYARLMRQQKGLEEITQQVSGRLKEVEITAAVSDSTAQVLDRATLPTTSLGTSRPVIFAVALFSGLIVGVAVAFLRDWLDTTVHNEQDVVLIARAPVIGIIPNLRQEALTSRYRSLVTGEFPQLGLPAGKATREGENQTMAAEAYRALRTNLSYVSPAKPPRVIVLTSALSGDGKTTSASNLAVTLAQQNKRVLLIDAETRRGNLHTLFGIEAQPGFFDLLYGQATPGECIRRVALEGTGHLDVLPSGGAPNANAADLLVAGRLAPFFERLRMQYDYVLIDTPPLNLFTDAALIGAHADATLLVARADRTERQALKFAVLQLQHVQANLAGAILNGVDLRRNSRYRGGYDFGRYGAYYN